MAIPVHLAPYPTPPAPVTTPTPNAGIISNWGKLWLLFPFFLNKLLFDVS
jgi:hypothetical protein